MEGSEGCPSGTMCRLAREDDATFVTPENSRGINGVVLKGPLVPGAGGRSFPLYGGTFARSYSVST